MRLCTWGFTARAPATQASAASRTGGSSTPPTNPMTPLCVMPPATIPAR